MKSAIIFCIISLLMSCHQEPKMFITDQVYETHRFDFSQGVMANDLLFISGQVGWDKNYHLTNNGSFQDQLDQALLNIEQISTAAGSSLHNTVLLRFYVVGLDMDKRKRINASLRIHFNDDYKPASTLVGIQSLAREELLIEIEAITKM